MNKIKGSNLYKSVMWILTAIFLAAFIISAIIMILMSEINVYSSGFDDKRDREIQEIIDCKIEKAVWEYNENGKILDYSNEGLYFGIRDSKNEASDGYFYSNLNDDMAASSTQKEIVIDSNTWAHWSGDLFYDAFWLSNNGESEKSYYCSGVTYDLKNHFFYYTVEDGSLYIARNVIISNADGETIHELTYNSSTKQYVDSIDSDENYADDMAVWSNITFDNIRTYKVSDIKCFSFLSDMNGKIVEVEDCYLNKNLSLIVRKSSGHYYSVDYYLDPSVLTGIRTMTLSNVIDHFLYHNQDVSDFEFVSNVFDWTYYYRQTVPGLTVIFALLTIICFICLFCSAGHRKNSEEITLTFFDKIPWDIFSCFYIVVILCCCGILCEYVRGYSNFEMVFATSISGIICILCTIWYLLSTAVRIKKRVLFKNTLIAIVLRFIGKYISKFIIFIKDVFSNIAIFWKSAVVMAVLLIIDFITLLILANDGNEICIIFGLMGIAKLAVCVFLLKLFRDAKLLSEATKKIADGHLEEKVDTSKMVADLKEYGENLNNISNGINYAVEAKIKSERMKTELITNVSHDIKTPLTSIINYVDLLEKEEIDNENAKEYLEVLDRQSKRLKKLIEDLVEASKASTGNLAVNVEKIDASVILSQAIGEFQEKLEANGLSLIVNAPEPPVEIMADGRHLWRVIDNVMNNICKYSENNSRVYVNLEQDDSRVKIIFRNMSKYQLNISGEELMERFVRGDESRNTEGHGLGLSIAKSLMNLMNGELEVITDGDLFKVILVVNK